jgi:hypothetical protein
MTKEGKQDTQIAFRLTKDELAQLREAALTDNLPTVTTWLRMVGLHIAEFGFYKLKGFYKKRETLHGEDLEVLPVQDVRQSDPEANRD